MSRSVILGNGQLAVGLDEKGHVHDFYYPYVGQENLTTSRSTHHRVGIMVDKKFTWTDTPDWEHRIELSDQALISKSLLVNKKLEIELEFTDFVDYQFDAFCRIIDVKNRSSKNRHVRLFMHQVFEISNNGRADTALYVPNQDYILDYKGGVSLLINGQFAGSSKSFDQYAVGNHDIEGKQGTFMDAEDGELSGHSVEHGGVDSVIRFSFDLLSQDKKTIEYWVAAGDSQFRCERINQVMDAGLDTRLNANMFHWTSWLSTAEEKLKDAPADYRSLSIKSLLTIKAHIDSRGGIIASCDSSIYNYGRDYYSYVWPRDGAYAIWPLIRLGYTEEAKKFFLFCQDIITNEGFLMHKYQPDRAVGSTWHPLDHQSVEELAIQEDETAIILFMLGEYLIYSGDKDFIKQLYNSFIVPMADFLASYIDDQTGLPHASYDLWEEKFLTSTYTTSVVYAGLVTAYEIAEGLNKVNDGAQRWLRTASKLILNSKAFINPDDGVLRKGFLHDQDKLNFDETLDTSSFFGPMVFGYPNFDLSYIKSTVQKIEDQLAISEHSITPRYMYDAYFRTNDSSKGNPWIVCSLWLAQYYLRTNQIKQAETILNSVAKLTLHSGVMPEQVHPESLEPISVTPLVWSHAEYVNTVLDLITKNKK